LRFPEKKNTIEKMLFMALENSNLNKTWQEASKRFFIEPIFDAMWELVGSDDKKEESF